MPRKPSTRVCIEPECGRMDWCRGYCSMHYQRHRTSGKIERIDPEQSPLERFMDKVELDNNGCWLWTSTILRSGYGTMWYRGQTISAHRLSYQFYIGPVPERLHVLHLCDVKRCVNPEHLYAGTHQQNIQDRENRGKNMRGTGNPRAVLSAEDVLEIRRRYAAGEKPFEIARDYDGIGWGGIYSVCRRKTWKHISG